MKRWIGVHTDVLDPTGRLIMRHLAREHERKGNEWIRYGVPWSDFGPEWEPFGAFRPLVEKGLLEAREDWKDVHVRITDAGWAALSSPNKAS